MDFTGINNRFGQIATSNFIEHLCSQSRKLSQALKSVFSARLQCSVSSCQWVSQKDVNDVFLKLYIPADKRRFTLEDLVDYNSNAVLDGDDAVYCGRCKVKTPHRLTREYDPDVLLIEIIRVTETTRTIGRRTDPRSTSQL